MAQDLKLMSVYHCSPLELRAWPAPYYQMALEKLTADEEARKAQLDEMKRKARR